MFHPIHEETDKPFSESDPPPPSYKDPYDYIGLPR